MTETTPAVLPPAPPSTPPESPAATPGDPRPAINWPLRVGSDDAGDVLDAAGNLVFTAFGPHPTEPKLVAESMPVAAAVAQAANLGRLVALGGAASGLPLPLSQKNEVLSGPDGGFVIFGRSTESAGRIMTALNRFGAAVGAMVLMRNVAEHAHAAHFGLTPYADNTRAQRDIEVGRLLNDLLEQLDGIGDPEGDGLAAALARIVGTEGDAAHGEAQVTEEEYRRTVKVDG